MSSSTRRVSLTASASSRKSAASGPVSGSGLFATIDGSKKIQLSAKVSSNTASQRASDIRTTEMQYQRHRPQDGQERDNCSDQPGRPALHQGIGKGCGDICWLHGVFLLITPTSA